MSRKRRYENFACIDWSGQAVERPKGLAVAYCATGAEAPTLLRPERGWSRHKILEWLLQHASANTDILIGVDLSPGLPFADTGSYFPGGPHQPKNAKELWQLVDEVCSQEPHLSASTFARHPSFRDHFRVQVSGGAETGSRFEGGAGRFRQAEHRQREGGVNPVSCFNLVGAAQVGKSSLTGMRVLNRIDGRLPVWPFDEVPVDGPVIVEIYTSIAARSAGIRKGRSKVRDLETLNMVLDQLGSKPHCGLATYDDHSTDALITSAWLRRVAANPMLWKPPSMSPAIAATEGWTFGAL